MKENTDMYWVNVSQRLPERAEGRLGEIELYCKTACGIEIVEFVDYEEWGKLETGYFTDTSVTEWLAIPGVTIAI